MSHVLKINPIFKLLNVFSGCSRFHGDLHVLHVIVGDPASAT